MNTNWWWDTFTQPGSKSLGDEEHEENYSSKIVHFLADSFAD